MANLCVLVVDDATFIRDLIKKSLREHFSGLELEEAANGRKAQQLLERRAVDLVLCDWEMPEMSGLELLAWLRAQPGRAPLPFIMITSRGDKDNVVQAIQAGVSDFIGKPFSTEQLVSKVRKALQRVGKLSAPAVAAAASTGLSGRDGSLAALTGGRAERVAASAPAPAPQRRAAAPSGSAGRGQGQLRLPQGSLDCTIKALSLQEALLLVRRGEPLPQVLDSAVLDLQQGEMAEVARLNGYLQAIAAQELKPTSEWLQITFRFVDRDPQKLDYLSRLIARGSAQKHFVPGA